MTEDYNEDISPIIASEPMQSWGGSWTEEKLDAFEKYVKAYLTIMKNFAPKNKWKLFYFDAFAGSGSRGNEEKEVNIKEENQPSGFFDSELIEVIINQSNYRGAAERVLDVNLDGFTFDYFYFIDKDGESLDNLKSKLTPQYGGRRAMAFRQGDANEKVLELVNYIQRNQNSAALVLLDPFGMQLKWDTVKALKHIKHLDLWILVPSGVIINRLLTRKGEIMCQERLSELFGMEILELQDYFYTKRTVQTLFGEETFLEKCNDSINRIAQLYLERLQKEFEFVIKEPLVLRNSTNCPIFHFVFASHNETATKIASQIVGKKNQKK